MCAVVFLYVWEKHRVCLSLHACMWVYLWYVKVSVSTCVSVRLSVHLFVSLSHRGIVSKRMPTFPTNLVGKLVIGQGRSDYLFAPLTKKGMWWWAWHTTKSHFPSKTTKFWRMVCPGLRSNIFTSHTDWAAMPTLSLTMPTSVFCYFSKLGILVCPLTLVGTQPHPPLVVLFITDSRPGVAALLSCCYYWSKYHWWVTTCFTSVWNRTK